jgi:hypothetical protein
MKNLIVTAIIFFYLSAHSFSQTSKNVLFIGNSYTYYNNLPQMLTDLARSAGDTMTFDSNTPGGYTFQGHSTNATSLAKISAGNWDFVVLQEQSQLPSFPINQVESSVFPYARILDSLVNVNNNCAETVFYMTWGRKFGDASNCANFAPLCTYEGMDSMLYLRYMMMADSNDAIVSPVGAVWRSIRQNYPLIDLYQSDNSHPSLAGSYAAACSFYATIFRKDPTLITNNYGLSAADALNIRQIAKTIVFDSLSKWHVGEYDPAANFNYNITNNYEVTFVNNSTNSNDFIWHFGDGISTSQENPVHTYNSPGTYTVTLISGKCDMTDSITETITITPVSSTTDNNQSTITISPNPVNDFFSINSDNIDNIVILNSIGQSIHSEKIVDYNKTFIYCNNWISGVYYIIIEISGVSSIRKIIKF